MESLEHFSITPKPFQNSYEEQHKSPSLPSVSLQQRLKSAEEPPKRSAIEVLESQTTAVIHQLNQNLQRAYKTEKNLRRVWTLRRLYPTYYDKMRQRRLLTLMAETRLRTRAIEANHKEAQDLLEGIRQQAQTQYIVKTLMLQELLTYGEKNDAALRERSRNRN